MQNIETEIIEFDKWLKQKNNRADNTRLEYARRIKKFLEWLCDTLISESSIFAYLESLEKDGMSDKTINCYRDAISAYIKFKGLNIESPPIRKIIQGIPDVIEDEAFFKDVIISVAEDIFARKSIKAIAILYLFHDSGLRPSSVIKLRRSDFDLEKRRGICINVKSKREQIFYFTDKGAEAIGSYFDSEEEKKNAFNLTKSGIARIFRVLQKSNKLKHINLRPYLFRHTVASRLLNDGVSDKEVQDFLGNASPASIQPYLKVNVSKFQDKYLNIMNN